MATINRFEDIDAWQKARELLCWFRACSLNRNILVQSRTIEPAKKYSVHQLVYYEDTNDIYAALQREKQLKNLSSCKRGWNRKWKLALIERINPDWNDPRLRSGTGFPLKACGNDIKGVSYLLPLFIERGALGGVTANLHTPLSPLFRGEL